MKPRHQRLALIGAAVAVLGLGVWFVLAAFRNNLVFFFTPTQVSAGEAPPAGTFRVGGMVEKGSIRRQPDGVTVTFVVTDLRQSIPVSYRGALPDLFKEGKGVVAQGEMAGGTVFLAREVLAKHDENYMPPEAAYALARKDAKEDGANAAGAR